MAQVGRTIAVFKCPCSDAESPPPSPAPRVSYWVEAEAPGGFPEALSGRCHRCKDRFCLLPVRELGVGEYRVFFWRRAGIGAAPINGDVVRRTWELEDCSQEGKRGFAELTQATQGA